MVVGKKGLELIKRFEGFQGCAYVCPAGVLTIGYGHTGSDVISRMVINELQAEEFLKKDLDSAERTVNMTVTGDINQYQFDALVSFVFNCGAGNFISSTLLKKVNTNPDDASIGAEFLKWNKANGKVLNGLVARRRAESDLYFCES